MFHRQNLPMQPTNAQVTLLHYRNQRLINGMHRLAAEALESEDQAVRAFGRAILELLNEARQ